MPSRPSICLLPVLFLMILPLAGGCASQWEKHFEPAEGAAMGELPRGREVVVRSVPYERLQRYEAAERQRQIESTTAPADWGPQQRQAAHQRLLEALQLKDFPRPLVVLGWSHFYTTDPPAEKELVAFARQIGADVVVVSVAPAGQVTTIQQEPVISHSDGWAAPVRTARGRYASGYFYSDRTTTWVPVPVTENQTYHQAFFLRSAAGQ